MTRLKILLTVLAFASATAHAAFGFTATEISPLSCYKVAGQTFISDDRGNTANLAFVRTTEWKFPAKTTDITLMLHTDVTSVGLRLPETYTLTIDELMTACEVMASAKTFVTH